MSDWSEEAEEYVGWIVRDLQVQGGPVDREAVRSVLAGAKGEGLDWQRIYREAVRLAAEMWGVTAPPLEEVTPV